MVQNLSDDVSGGQGLGLLLGHPVHSVLALPLKVTTISQSP